jgi:D-glycero-alpha-D-manno-heptose-7-phosphate kinase
MAPIRICDTGGWTDTWFAQYGAVFNIAVAPYIEVQVQVFQGEIEGQRLWLDVADYGDQYSPHLDQPGWDRHPLLEATIRRVGVPQGKSLYIHLHSQIPGGASTGTSAAVTVALIGALDCLTPGRMTPLQVADMAHQVETLDLKRQSGIQDQLCSAYGGLNYIEMFGYPQGTVTPLAISPELSWELERRLVLIYLGKSHDSSRVHERVIARLEDAGPDNRKLEDLRIAAERSREAVLSGDLNALGKAMIANTHAQANLHPDLVSADAWRVIEIAQAHGAAGWKVNGAGGGGGSLTLLGDQRAGALRAMEREIEVEAAGYKNIPLRLDPYGLRCWRA